MSRLIDTTDIYNRVQARDDLGVFRNTIGHIVMGIVGDCPTAEDKQAKKETINAVLEIIDERTKALDGRIPTVRFAYQSLRKDVEKLRGEEE